jgi:acetyl esterase/lipase
MNASLLNLETVLRKIGRGVVMYAVDESGDPTVWDGTSALLLAHLTDTEGDITMKANGTIAALTLPEIAGDAQFAATYTGEAPTLELPLFIADPDLLPIISPVDDAGAGHIRVREVAERTIVIFPEALFRKTDGTYAALAYTVGGGWTLGGVAVDAAHQTLLSLTVWAWRGYFERPDRMFKGGHGNDAKNIVTVTFNVMMHPTMPDGQRLYTTGDPALVGIAIDGTS